MDFRDRRAASGSAVGEGQTRITCEEDQILSSLEFSVDVGQWDIHRMSSEHPVHGRGGSVKIKSHSLKIK